MSGGRNRRALPGIQAADANAKNQFNRNRFDTATSAGELLADVSGQIPYHLGSTRYIQQTNFPITRGNPKGAFDVEHRSAAELVHNLTGRFNVRGGIILSNPELTAEAASIIAENLRRKDVVKFNEFKSGFLGARGIHGQGGSAFLDSNFKFTGTSANRVAPPTTPSTPKSPAGGSLVTGLQAGKKKGDRSRRAGSLVTGPGGLSALANTEKKTLLG